MSGSGSRKSKETLKNIDMLTVRNVTQQEVTNVIFPNGITVGVDGFNSTMRVHGNAQISGIVNAQDLRINGTTVANQSSESVTYVITPEVVTLKQTYSGIISAPLLAAAIPGIRVFSNDGTAAVLTPSSASPKSTAAATEATDG